MLVREREGNRERERVNLTLQLGDTPYLFIRVSTMAVFPDLVAQCIG